MWILRLIAAQNLCNAARVSTLRAPTVTLLLSNVTSRFASNGKKKKKVLNLHSVELFTMTCSCLRLGLEATEVVASCDLAAFRHL